MIDLNDVIPIGLSTRQPGPSLSEVGERLNDRIEDLAQVLLGEPNRALSTRVQLRYGRKGSVAVELVGAKRGQWYDHEDDVGGDGMALVSRELGLANGAACDWAIEWLGLDRVDAIRVATRPSARPAQIAEPRESVFADPERAAKVASIVGDCQDPASSSAEIYLRKRGITATSLPASIRYRPNAHGRYGALVALATDAGGTTNAVQQIYLTSEGRKAPVKIQKRTNKGCNDWSDTSAVRLPGEPPFILCEGVETSPIPSFTRSAPGGR